jgi:hypothetical protein
MAVPRQLSLLGASVAVAELPPDPGADYGEVFTRRWIVELILDLVGYLADEDLGSRTLVEPSCGTGAFLVPVVDRLIASCRDHGRDLSSIAGCIRAFDLLEANAQRARKAVALRLEEAGLHSRRAEEIASIWITTGDFLLEDHGPGTAHHVVGNPPYIRLENVRPQVMEAYRQRCATMRGRSDIYVGFIELGVELLVPDGTLGFICADRWMRNQYGAQLRELITRNYALDAIISMHDVNAFEDSVSAYPAIVVLRNEPQHQAVVADAKAGFDESAANSLQAWVRWGSDESIVEQAYEASRMESWSKGRDPWPTGSPSQLALIADLESRFAPLQNDDTKTRVGIGVATGCDDVFITSNPELVEAERLLPILQAPDTVSGTIEWAGRYLVNPWDEHGLVDLDAFPRLAEYFKENSHRLRRRHIAQRRPAVWYRTIDRIDHKLTEQVKLVLPDMKAAAHPVLDDGRFYPHHNLYYVVSSLWDAEVLGGLLLSDFTNLFVGAYCVRMRGGTFRFQAQYLRRIRVPDPRSISQRSARLLAKAFQERDCELATATAAKVYGVSGLRLP